MRDQPHIPIRSAHVRQVIVCTLLALCSPSPDASANDPHSDLTFAVMGHVYPSVDRPEILRAAVEQLNTIGVSALFLLGDLVRTGTDDEWDRLESLLVPLQAPWYALPGNHDLATEQSQRNWASRMGNDLHRVVDIEGFRFIMLNTNTPSRSGPPSPSNQGVGLDDNGLAFLRESLNRSNNHNRTFVMMHHPLWLEESNLTNRPYRETHWHDRIAPLLRRNVEAVFAGDVASYFRTTDDGLDLYAVGFPLTDRHLGNRVVGHEQIYRSKPFFLVVRCSADQVRVTPVAVDGDIRSDIFNTNRLGYPPRNPWTIVGLMAMTLRNIELALSIVATVFFGMGVGVTLLFRRARRKESKASAM
jgi:calcineurin-like phosphoesterase family protein